MAVEIRELVIKTNIVSRNEPERAPIPVEQLLMLKKQIVQECLKALRDKAVHNRFDR